MALDEGMMKDDAGYYIITYCYNRFKIYFYQTSETYYIPTPRQKAGNKKDSCVLECTNSDVSLISDSDSEFSFMNNSIMTRHARHDAPNQEGEDLSLTREASELG
jgi:hypothetical protein